MDALKKMAEEFKRCSHVGKLSMAVLRKVATEEQIRSLGEVTKNQNFQEILDKWLDVGDWEQQAPSSDDSDDDSDTEVEPPSSSSSTSSNSASTTTTDNEDDGQGETWLLDADELEEDRKLDGDDDIQMGSDGFLSYEELASRKSKSKKDAEMAKSVLAKPTQLHNSFVPSGAPESYK
jgi:hypothetical protein